MRMTYCKRQNVAGARYLPSSSGVVKVAISGWRDRATRAWNQALGSETASREGVEHHSHRTGSFMEGEAIVREFVVRQETQGWP